MSKIITIKSISICGCLMRADFASLRDCDSRVNPIIRKDFGSCIGEINGVSRADKKVPRDSISPQRDL